MMMMIWQKRDERNMMQRVERTKNRTELIIERQAKREEIKVPFQRVSEAG